MPAFIVCEKCRPSPIHKREFCVHTDANCGRIFHIECYRSDIAKIGRCDCGKPVTKTDFMNFGVECVRNGVEASVRLIIPAAAKRFGSCGAPMDASDMIAALRAQLENVLNANCRLHMENAEKGNTIEVAKEMLAKRNAEATMKDKQIEKLLKENGELRATLDQLQRLVEPVGLAGKRTERTMALLDLQIESVSAEGFDEQACDDCRIVDEVGIVFDEAINQTTVDEMFGLEEEMPENDTASSFENPLTHAEELSRSSLTRDEEAETAVHRHDGRRSTRGKSFDCALCERRFSIKAALERHLITHSAHTEDRG